MSKPGPILVLGGQGYIGGALVKYLGAKEFTVRSVDAAPPRPVLPTSWGWVRYQDLSAKQLTEYETVVLLAGHSTIAACAAEPVKSFENNVSGFVELIHKLRGQKFIYASSVSVYVETEGPFGEGADLHQPAEIYDFQKQEIERYAKFIGCPHTYGLRFGTVCGPAPNMRPTLLNGMVQSAVRDGRVVVANPNNYRPLLGLGDLCRAVETIITGSVVPGVYNLASTNIRIGAVGNFVAHRLGVPVVAGTGTTPYNIQVMTSRFCREANFEFRDTLESLTDALTEHFRK
jgi:nucleoside-diphosphate-sugar epimerase